MQFGVFEKFTSAYLYLLIIYVQNFQTNSLQFVIILPYVVNTLRLQESDWSKHLSSCLYFVACFRFGNYPLNFELSCCFFRKPVRHFVSFFVFELITCQSFFNFLH